MQTKSFMRLRETEHMPLCTFIIISIQNNGIVVALFRTRVLKVDIRFVVWLFDQIETLNFLFR